MILPMMELRTDQQKCSQSRPESPFCQEIDPSGEERRGDIKNTNIEAAAV
jgi:hypothetical protein